MRFWFRPAIKALSLRRRHLGIIAKNRIKALAALKSLKTVAVIKKLIIERIVEKDMLVEDAEQILDDVLCVLLYRYHQLAHLPLIDVYLRKRLPRILRSRCLIEGFTEEEIPQKFRFRNKCQLRRLIEGFRLPDKFVVPSSGEVFTADEMLLVGLYRMHYPNLLTDEFYISRMGMQYSTVSTCFNHFLKFMINNWGYLLLDNMQYWKPLMPVFAEAIRQKMMSLGCYFPSASDPNGGFRVFSYIDNTMNATCRPGGGPMDDGTNARRNDANIQRAFYNGWKKLHGLKWQTIDLPNGMTFAAHGPFSIRHNDLYTLDESRFNEKLAALQHGENLQFVTYGDSAYIVAHLSHVAARHNNPHLTNREILENSVLGRGRISIEWDYGDVGTKWKLVDYKNVLKLRRMPVADMYLLAMILRNAYNAMNGGIASEYFNLPPPSFEHWVSQGPR